jgi:hypothetical protein
MTPPAIPIIDLTSAPQRISPTDMSQYIRLDQCRRYLRLRLHERTHGQRFLRAYDVTPQSIPPILSLSGERFEERVEAQATAMIGAAINCADAALEGEDEFIGEHQNAVVLAHARDLAPGAALLLFQPRLQVTIGAWQLRGTVDILLLRRDLQGSLMALIVDMKSSTAAKVEHRLQVAFYHAMLATLFAAGEVAYERIATAILYRGPSADAPAPGPAEQARLAAQRTAAQAVLGVDNAYLELVDDPEAYLAEVRTLVTDPDSLAAEVASAPFESIGFHLTYKCDGCLYNEFCMKWAAEMDDLSLIPYLADTEKNALRAGGVTTTTALAGLKTFRDAQSTDLVPAPGQEQLVRALSAHRALGPRLDELVHRARRFRSWKGDDLRALTFIPSKGYGTLPASDATIHPNLVRIYLDVQHDYLHDRLYLLSALVAACEAGAEPPERRRMIVRLADAPPDTPERERDLLLSWVGDVLQAVVELAAPDAEGQRCAPIHLIFFNAFAQQLLLDALARHFGAVAGATPLYDFITQIAGFDSPVATILEHERRELKNDPLVCPSLQALARGRRFDWGEYRRIFRVRMFDDVGRLDPGGGEEGTWYTGRARFNSQIPLEYAYAAWNQLTEKPVRGLDPFNSYRAATPELMRGFAARRMEAIEYLAREFPGNRQTEKSAFVLPDLDTFAQKARTLADALHEFLTLERHTALAAWKQAHLAPPERRALAGISLIVRFEEADQSPEFVATVAENRRRRALRDQYAAEFLAANPGRKRATLTAAQRAETAPIDLSAPYRLRIDLTGVDCDLATALRLTTFSAGDRLILAPRWSVDERLPPEQQQRFTPTAKQLLYQSRMQIVAIDAAAGIIEMMPTQPMGGGDKRYTFSAHPAEPIFGEQYTLEADPSDIYGQRCMQIVEELRAGATNALLTRLVDPANERVAWPEAARVAQQRFAEGLDALHAAGVLHPFDENQRAYIAERGDTSTLLVQGPPGTGKSYSTAFALLARLQGALSAGQPFRALLTCKTHAATDVLLEKIAQVQALLAGVRTRAPAIFDAYFDPRILDTPLYRVHPRTDPPPDARWSALDRDVAQGILSSHRYTIAAITPFATSAASKGGSKQYHNAPWCDCLVLDEASQMNLPEACMAALPLRPDGQLIIVGDHRQMPPIVQHGWATERRRTFQEYRAYASLFEILLERQPPAPIVRFAESFRLHRDIARFLRDEIYIRDGIAYHSRRSDTLAAVAYADDFLAGVLAPQHPLIVVVHEESGSQSLNQYELGLISPILRALAEQHGLDATDGLGVVVPHRAQRAALKEALPTMLALLDGDLDESAVDTVERFQGGERTAILVSATESDPDYLRSAGEFLLDPRRLNVALSRAKQKLILVAARAVFTQFSTDEQIFAHTQIWKNLLRRACTTLLWQGERDGVRVQVWGNTPDVESHP